MLADDERQQWRTRLKRAHPWCCSICKTSYASQTQRFRGEVVRHSECGHVLFWRSGIRELAQRIEPNPVNWVLPPLARPRTRRQPERKPAA